MVVLSCKNIKKSYGIDIILSNITFNINEGENIGFVGPNGAGKSTLFKILCKKIEADSGEIYIDKNKKIGYLSQHLSLESDNTIYDEILLVFNELIDLENKVAELEIELNKPYDINNRDYHDKVIKSYTELSELYVTRGGYTYKGEINKVLKGLGFSEGDYTKKINILSGGQKTRVALCKLLLSNPEILLLDEPTNHLDLEAIEWLEEYLTNYKGTIIVISHDRFFLDSITDKTIEIQNGEIEMYNGNYTKFIDLKKKRLEEKQKAYSLQQNEIKRQEEIIDKYKSFNREKSIRAARSRQKSLDKIERIKEPPKEHKIHRITFDADIKSGNDVLHAENLKKQYGEKLLFENVFLDINSGEKTALIGENGRGKTTLFKIIMNKLSPDDGFISLGKNVIIGYYDQEQSDLHFEKTIIDEVWDAYPHMTTTELRNALAAFLYRGDDVFKEISNLSGGEKCRINLLKLMLSKSNFLLLDEPTNHLDVMSREALEDALMSYDGTILVISHDRYFLNKVVTKIHELTCSEIKTYLGNYSYFIEKKKNPNRFIDEENYTGKTKTQIKNEKKKLKEEKKLQKQKELEVKRLEESIANLEMEIEELQNKLCLEEVYSSPEKSEGINKKIKLKEDNLSGLYEEWENSM
ncbi:ABC-F family ATP-binding cassette domain-containing protein [Clostridium sediminicola]|uniref:ABC-F family ATP-binding cassette domain-containing protein n=1 Tax=Clostridium sediminicola TaxID=3114879 RepID=UPI0031F1C67C